MLYWRARVFSDIIWIIFIRGEIKSLSTKFSFYFCKKNLNILYFYKEKSKINNGELKKNTFFVKFCLNCYHVDKIPPNRKATPKKCFRPRKKAIGHWPSRPLFGDTRGVIFWFLRLLKKSCCLLIRNLSYFRRQWFLSKCSSSSFFEFSSSSSFLQSEWMWFHFMILGNKPLQLLVSSWKR